MDRIMEEVIEFYDHYTERQKKTGVNKRHFQILEFLKETGVRPGHKILEIGCGVGTLTSLISKYIGKKGKVIAIDISPKSIDVGKRILNDKSNIFFFVNDIVSFETKEKFDVIVLPDVLEHIPIAKHNDVFKKINELLVYNGIILIHIPDPVFLNWIRERTPEKLQIIDQSLTLSHIGTMAEKNDLYITRLQSYSIWHEPFDYQLIVLRKKSFSENISIIQERWSFFKKLMSKFKTFNSG